jgi:ABC-type multidrug transport system fused ATPase/permease subunit
VAKSFTEYVSYFSFGLIRINGGADLAKASVAAGRIIDMRNRDHVDGKLISLDVGNIGDDDMGVKVQFQNVWFRYSTRDVPILNGLSLTVSKPQADIAERTGKLTIHAPDRERTICGHCWFIRYGHQRYQQTSA